MTEQLRKSNQKEILINQFDEEDWLHMMKNEPKGYSWREEAYLAGEDYFEEGKVFLRSN